MPAYSEKQLGELQLHLENLPDRANDLVHRVFAHRFGTQAGKEAGHHGLARRLNSMSHSILRIYEELPPELNDIPDRGRCLEATTHLHSMLIHCYGCFDNLAQIWVAERNVRNRNGKPLARPRIGFLAKHKEVRKSLPDLLLQGLESFDPWISFLEEFRHSTAHRTPAYIPPFLVPQKNEIEYQCLESKKQSLALRRDWDSYDRIEIEQMRLAVFRPVLSLSIYEPRFSNFHVQLLADFSTIEDWSNRIFDELSSSAS